jgi:hypothetical protein
MKARWLVVACGATLVVGIPGPARAADSVTGLVVRAEVRGGFSPSRFPGASSSRVPLVVPLREAWESGANAWSPARRAKYARTAAARSAEIGLTAKSSANRGDRDPAQWLPASTSRCAYVAKWIAVKKTFGLAADTAEVARLRRLVTGCAQGTPTATTTSPAAISATTTATAPGVASTTKPSTAATVPVAGSSVLDLLATIRIVPEYSVGYDRDLFPHWKDLDGDGCDTRKEVLIRDSRSSAVIGSSCTVVSGTWYSPYDGATWTNPSDVDIDHVVALNEAWQSGAYAWSTQQRTNYANDLTDGRTLLAVTDSVNQSKSDKDPTAWLPSLASYRCTYLANWVSVKARWLLAMDEAEHAAVKSGLSGCTGTSVAVAPAPPTATSGTVATPGSPATPPTSSSGAGQVAAFVTPGAYCAPYGATGVSQKGVAYTCKPSQTESRNRWRR